MIAIKHWHVLQGYDDPTKSPQVKKTMRGISRMHGIPRRQAAAISLQDLDKLLAHLKAGDHMALRNRALILCGFYGAFRRSELVSLCRERIKFVRDGMIIQLKRSKTDQTGEGLDCVIPFGHDQRCAVRALIDWRQASGHYEGLIFRRLSKGGLVNEKGITANYFNKSIKKLALEAKLAHAQEMSSHSLRRGFATEAARLGASMPAIQRHGRWRTTKTVVEYIEAGRQFKDSAVNVLLEVPG